MNGLLNLAEVLESGNNEIHVDPAIIPRAVLPITAHAGFCQADQAADAAGSAMPERRLAHAKA